MSGCSSPPSQPSSDWPHCPAYFCAHPQVRTKSHEPGEALPFGVPIEFESDLFEGRMFCRLQAIDSHPDDKNHAAYFDGAKRFYQVILQGQFKEELCMSDLFFGDHYEKPFKGIPKGLIMKSYQKFMQVLSPGIIMDMISDTPQIFTAFGSCQIMRIDNPGEEPDVTGVPGNITENTSLLGKEFESIKNRRSHLSKPKNSSKFTVNPKHVYTIELFDHTMNFGTYYQHLFGGHKIDMVPSMNGQPLSFGFFTRDKRMIFKFPIWHERLLDAMKEESS